MLAGHPQCARAHARTQNPGGGVCSRRTHALIHAHTHTRAHASTHADLQEGVGLTAHRNCRRVWRVQRLQGPAYPSQRLHGGRPRRCHGWNACEFARLFVRLFPCKPCKGLSKCRDRSGSATDPAPPFHCPPPRARQAPRTGPGSQSAVGCEPRELRPGVSRHLETSTHLDISPGPRVAVAGAVEHQPETWCAPNGLPRSTVRRCCAEIACGVRVRCLL